MASETPSSAARRMSVSRLVRSSFSSVLRPMPVTGCSRISASSDGVKFLLRCLLFTPAHALALPSMACALTQVREARRLTDETRARERQHSDYNKSGHLVGGCLSRFLLGMSVCFFSAAQFAASSSLKFSVQ
jgi:hypothetical protein